MTVETEILPLVVAAGEDDRRRQYAAIAARLELLLEGVNGGPRPSLLGHKFAGRVPKHVLDGLC